MIELKGVDVRKSGAKVLEAFSWRIEPGEHWVITGGNGSGKTTLLEVLAGDVHVTQGSIHYGFIRGNSWDERYAERKELIHYIPAHPVQTFLHHDQGIYYQQRYYGIGDERVPRVRDLLGEGLEKISTLALPESLSIDSLLGVEVTKLSNGQLKKVLFLKTLLKNIPRVLLLDYPFEGLDEGSRKDLCDFIDVIAATYSLQVIIADNHNHLPAVINRKLILPGGSTAAFTDIKSETVIEKKGPEFFGQKPIIEIRNLKISYGGNVILRNFNWKVNQGERWALVGRNGSGKTTLFSLIFADHPMAYSQEIYLFGRRRGSGESIWDIKRRINYLGPELISYLSPKGISLTARQYIVSVNRGLNKNTFDDLIRHFQAEDFIDRPVRRLSSGQLQLMLIIHCFLTDKEVFLLDEPFQFLDLRQRKHLTAYLQAHLSRDKTLILITHYKSDLAEWTEHTMHL